MRSRATSVTRADGGFSSLGQQRRTKRGDALAFSAVAPKIGPNESWTCEYALRPEHVHAAILERLQSPSGIARDVHSYIQ